MLKLIETVHMYVRKRSVNIAIMSKQIGITSKVTAVAQKSFCLAILTEEFKVDGPQ
jgi:hypothetical protein